MKKAMSVKKNIWGNYVCYISGKRVIDFGQEWDAQEWLNSNFNEESYYIPSKSDLYLNQIHRFTKPISIYCNTPDDAPNRLCLH